MIRYKKNLTPEEITGLTATNGATRGTFETTLGKMSFFEAQDFFPSTQPITRFTAYLLCVNDDGTVNGEKSQIFRDSQQSLSTDISRATDPIYVLARDIFNITRGESGFSLSMAEGSSMAVETALERVAQEGCKVQLVISASLVSNAKDAKFQAPQITQDDLNLKSLLKYLTLERILETQIWFDGRANSEIISIIEEHISLTEEDLKVILPENSRTLIFSNDKNMRIAGVNLNPLRFVEAIQLKNAGDDYDEGTLSERSLIVTFSTTEQRVIPLPEDGGSDDSAKLAALAGRVAAIEAAPGGGVSSVETEAPIEGDGTEDNPIKLQQRSISKDFLSPEVLATIQSGGQDSGEYKQTSELSKREVFHVPLQNFGFDSNGNPISDSDLDELLGDIVSVFRKDGHDVYLTSKGWTSDSSQRLRAFSPSGREIIDNFTFYDAETHGHRDRFYVIASSNNENDENRGLPKLYSVTSGSRDLTPSPGYPIPLSTNNDTNWIDFVFEGGSEQVPNIRSIEYSSATRTTRFVTRRAAQPYTPRTRQLISTGVRCFTPYKNENEYLLAYNSGTEDTALHFFDADGRITGAQAIHRNITLKGVNNITSIEYAEDKFIITDANSVRILEFASVPTLLGLEDTPSTYGQPGQKITPNAGRSSLEWVDDEVLDVGSLTELLEGTTNNQKTEIKDALNIVSGGSSFAFKQGRANPNTFSTGALLDNTFESSASPTAGSGYILGQGINPANVFFAGSSTSLVDPDTAVVSPIQFTENGEKVLGFIYISSSGLYIVAGDHNNSVVEADFPSQITLILNDNSRATMSFSRILRFNVNLGNGLRNTKPMAYYTVSGHIPDQVDKNLIKVELLSDESGRRFYINTPRGLGKLPGAVNDLYRQDDADGNLIALWIRRANDWERINFGTSIGTHDPNGREAMTIPIKREVSSNSPNTFFLLGEGVGSDNYADILYNTFQLDDPVSINPEGFRFLHNGVPTPGFILRFNTYFYVFIKNTGSVLGFNDLNSFPEIITINGVTYNSYARRIAEINFGDGGGSVGSFAGARWQGIINIANEYTITSSGAERPISIESARTEAIPRTPGIKGDEYFRSNTKQHFVHNGLVWVEAGNEGLLFDRLGSINAVLGAHPDNVLDDEASWTTALLDDTTSDLDNVKFISGSRINDKNYALLSNNKVQELDLPSSTLFTLNLALGGTPVAYCSAEVDTLSATDQIVPDRKYVLHFVVRRLASQFFVDRYQTDGSYSASVEVTGVTLLEDNIDCFVEANTLYIVAQADATSNLNIHSLLYPQTLTHAAGTDTLHIDQLGDHFDEFAGCHYEGDKLYVASRQSDDDFSTKHYIVTGLNKRVGDIGSAWLANDDERTIPGFTEKGTGVIVWDDIIFITEDRAVRYSASSVNLSDRVVQNRDNIAEATNRIEQLQNETNGLLAALGAHTGVYQVDSSMRLQDFETQTGDDFSTGASFVGVVHIKDPWSEDAPEIVTACIKKGNMLHIRGEHNFDISDFGTATNPIIGFERAHRANSFSRAFDQIHYIVVYRSGLWATFDTSGAQTGSATLATNIFYSSNNLCYSIAVQSVHSNNYLWVFALGSEARNPVFIYEFFANNRGILNTSNNISGFISTARLNPALPADTKIAYYNDKIYLTHRGSDSSYTTEVRTVIESSNNKPNRLSAPITTTALNVDLPVPTLDFTNEIEDISVDGKDFTYTLAGISVRLTIGTTIDIYRPTDTVLFDTKNKASDTFSTPIRNRWYLPSLSSANQAKINNASSTAELTIAIQYASFSSSAVTATATGNLAICEFELPIVVFRDFLQAIPGSSGNSSFAASGTHSRLSNRVQNPSLTSAMGRAIYVAKDSAGRIRIATSDEQNFRVTELHITLLE